MIWSPAAPVRATIGSATPSSLTRRSIVCRACSTASSRSCTTRFGFITKLYDPPAPDSRLKRVSTSMAASRNAASWAGGTPSTLNRVGSTLAKVRLVSPLVSSGLPQLLHRRLGVEPECVVGLHAEHEVYAALEVEAQPDLLLRGVESPDRHSDDGKDGDGAPAKILVHNVTTARRRRAQRGPAPGSRPRPPWRSRSGLCPRSGVARSCRRSG